MRFKFVFHSKKENEDNSINKNHRYFLKLFSLYNADISSSFGIIERIICFSCFEVFFETKAEYNFLILAYETFRANIRLLFFIIFTQ